MKASKIAGLWIPPAARIPKQAKLLDNCLRDPCCEWRDRALKGDSLGAKRGRGGFAGRTLGI
jgi:hypothetical protein